MMALAGDYDGQIFPNEHIFSVKITATSVVSGLNLYTWVEQVDDGTGNYKTPSAPRQGSSANAPFLSEINNALLTTFPVFAQARLRAFVAGQPWYEFSTGSPGAVVAFVKITNGTPDANGLYQAVLELYTIATLTWSNGGAVLAAAPNAETLANGTRYLADPFGNLPTATIGGVAYTGQPFWMTQEVSTAFGSSGQLLAVTIFTSNGTWTANAGTNTIEVEAVGGGGGGAGAPQSFSNCSAAGGGASGDYVYFRKASAGLSPAGVLIGSGGAGGTSAGTVGGTGGDTTVSFFNSTVVKASGNTGGNTGSTGPGYVAAGGLPFGSSSVPGGGISIISFGNSGGQGISPSTDTWGTGGPGGKSNLGPGGNGGYKTSAGFGVALAGAGTLGGGGGGAVGDTAAGKAGGAGGAGIVIVREYS